MGITVSHSLSATTPDNPLFEIQPKHWNSNHIATINAVGSEISGAFGNGGGVTFGLSADGKVTAAGVAQTVQSQNFVAVIASGANGNGTFTSGTLSIKAGNNITLSTGANVISIHAPAPGAAAEANAINLLGNNTAGSTTASGSTIGWSGINLTLSGTNDSQVVISAAAPKTGISGIIVSDATYTSGTVSFSNAGNITISSSVNGASQYIVLSGNAAQTVQTQNMVAVVASAANGNGTFSSGSVSLKVGANVTFSTGANVVSLYGEAAQTVQTQNMVAVVASGGNGNGTYSSGSVSFKNGSNITFSTGANVISVFAADQSAQTQNLFAAIVSGANGNLTQTSGTLSVKAGNNITLSTGANVFSIHGEAAQTVQTQNFVAIIASAANGNGTFTSGTVSLKIGSNLTMSTGANVISFYAADPGAAAEANAHNLLGNNTAGNTTATGSTIGLSGINLTLSGTNNSQIVISAAAPKTGISGIIVSDATYTSGTVSFSNAGNITISSSVNGASQYIVLSGNAAQTVQSQNFVAVIASGANGNGTFTSGTVSLKVGSNITLSTGANVVSIYAVDPNYHNLLGANTAGNTTASGLTLGLSGLNLTLSGTNNSQIVVSAPATSSIVGINGISISTAGSTISVLPQWISSYENFDNCGSNTMTLNAASISHAVAFYVPQPISGSFIRIPVLMTTNSTTIATIASATASASGELYSTWNAVVYSLGVGGNSKSLQYVASGSGAFTFQNRISITNTTQYSITQAFSAQANGAGTTRTTQYSISNTNYSFTTNQIATEWSSGRFMDIPFASSLSPGAYWLVFGYSSSSNSAGAGGLAAMTNCNVRYSNHYAVSQVDIAFGIMGSTNLSSGGLIGAGSFSTAGGGTTNSLPISAISSSASHVRPYFQILRSA